MKKAKLFLSYGRRDAEGIALRIKEDLERAGYEVWMDRSEIKAGTEWTEAITSGLNESQAMVALLSPHAVRMAGKDGSRDDSVCLDEIAYARDCPGKILPVMVADCTVPFVLYRLHYVDLRTWQIDDDAYAKGLAELVECIDAAVRNETRYRSWQKKLQPWDFTPFLEERRRGFVGRHWLLEEVSDWLQSGQDESSLLITGDPGIGKSAFVGQWVHLNPGGHLLAYHCCQVQSPTTLQPYCFIRSIAAMIASQLPAYEQLLNDPAVAEALQEDTCRADPARGFDAGILAPLRRIEPPVGGIRCILIDALDEAVLLQDSPNIVDVIAGRLDSLPTWLKVVATTRKETAVLRKLEGLRATCLDAQDARNAEDASEYLGDRLSSEPLLSIVEESGIGIAEATELLLSRSAGNFLYMRYALDGLVKGVYRLDRPDGFPPNLRDFYEEAFRHRFTTDQEYDQVAGLLAAVLGAREPLNIKLLQAASGLTSQRELRRALRKLAVYLPEREGRFVIFHRSFAEWLQDCGNNEDFCLEPLQGEMNLAEIGWSEFEADAETISPYMMSHLPYHLASTCQWERLATLLTDFTILHKAWSDGREHEWMRHWRLMMDRVDMVEAYQKSLDRLLESSVEELEVARVTMKVGVLLRDLGLVVKARPFVEKSVEILRQMTTGGDQDLATALLELAETYRRNALFREALPLYEEALEIRERIFGPDSPEVGDAVHSQCVYHNTCDKRDVDRSMALNERAVRILEKQDPPDYAALGDAVNDQGVLLVAKGDHDAAMPYFLRSRELFETGFPDGHPELGVVISNIARGLRVNGKIAEAIPLHEEGLRMRLLFVVPYDEQCQDIRRCLVQYNVALKRFPEALAAAVAVIEQDDNDPLCHESVLYDDILNMAYVAQIGGDTRQREAAVSRLSAVASDGERTLYESTWVNLASFFVFAVRHGFQEGDVDGTIALFQRYREAIHAVEPAPMQALSAFYEGIAAIWHELGITETEQEFRRLSELFSMAVDKRAPALVTLAEADRMISEDRLEDARNHVAEIFESTPTNDPDEAWRRILAQRANALALRVKNEKNAYDLTEWFYGHSTRLNPNDANVVGNYAFFLTSIRGKHDEAEEQYRRALALNPEDPNCLSNFAVFHSQVRQDLDEAERLFTRAVERRPNVGSILGNFAVLRLLQGDLEETMLLARRSHEICKDQPDRIAARPLFCAVAVSLLRQEEPQPYLAQMKTLFLTGIDRVPWQADRLMEHLRDLLPAAAFRTLDLVFAAICTNGSDASLDEIDGWTAARPLPLDRPWPE